MMNDSVREELQTKISAAPIFKKEPDPVPVIEPTPVLVEPKKEPVKRYETAELFVQKTSPTLVDFQPKNPVVPDWRLQLQNAVRGRSVDTNTNAVSTAAAYKGQLSTNGANALKAQFVEEARPAPAEHKDPRVANALKRINESRKVFMNETSGAAAGTSRATASRNFPFNVVARTPDTESRPADGKASINVLPKPTLVPTFRIEKKDFDTNKLKPIPEADTAFTVVDEPFIPAASEQNFDVVAYSESDLMHITEPDVEQETPEAAAAEASGDEIEDLAPFAMRFNAGIFDLIIGGFASLVLLSPIAFFGGDWFSMGGALAFAASWSIVMFVYLTVCIGIYGRTIGMQMFSLEIIDADENAYPTLHQAAVSSAVYLLSLPLLGAGFVTIFFNEEKRAAHDLLSGTIIVNEF
jgi:uncharacterized RDD family membrane protein YckC